jgi:ABC-2 type transport system permease protein
MYRIGKYIALANATFQQRLAYRNVFFLHLVGQVIVLLSLYFVWKAVYTGRESLAGFGWADMQSYLLLTFVVNAVIGMHSELMLSYRILDGSVAVDLLKPLDYQAARFVEASVTALIEGATAIVAAIAIALLLGGTLLPADALHGVLGLVSFALGVLIKFGVVFVAGLACFWTTNGWGISWAQTAVSQLFSGALVPLPFLPDWLRALAEWLPFHGIAYTPIAIHLGKVDPAAATGLLFQQLLWAIALWLGSRALWSVMVRKVTIHGG